VTLVAGWLVCLAAGAAGADPLPGLVAAYAFGEGSGITAADSSGNGHHGAISGATWTTGRYGAGLSFDGINDWVTVADAPALDLSTGMTLMAWIFPTAASGVRDVVVKEGAGKDHYNVYYRNWRGQPEANVLVGGANRTAEGSAVPANTWTHLAGTYDGATVRLFVNGALVSSVAAAGSMPASAGPLRIGGNSLWGEFFLGKIDEVRVYNRALTPSEIAVDMTTPISSGTSQPNPLGQWSEVLPWPIVAVHMTLLPTGDVLAWDGGDFGRDAYLWHPASGTFFPVRSGASNLFCAGHAVLPDGRLIAAGGHTAAYVGITDVNVFDPANATWSVAAPMSYARWYPTTTVLPDGRLVTVSGDIDCQGCTAEIPEVYDPATGAWTALTAAPLSVPLYPHMFVLPDGRVLVAGAAGGPVPTRILDVDTQTWTTVASAPLDAGSSAMYLPGKVIRSGSSSVVAPGFVSAVADTHVLDMTQPSPGWRPTAPMAIARTQHTLTLLPDGTVLATGGSRNSDVFDLGSAALEAELWSPVTETWSRMAPMTVPRHYHSTALLLPDGRVLVAGSGREGVDRFDAEIFSPPYLFRGPRPTITSAPASTGYGAAFSIQTPDASRIAKVSLVRLGSVTHAFNQDQRFLPLAFQQVGAELQVQAPANAALAPPGYYMLFILDSDGVPSVASFVRLVAPVANVSDLVAAYAFDEGAGATAADVSGNGHQAAISGATWTTGRFGSGLSFDGVNDWVTIPVSSDLDLTTGMTLAAWVYPTAQGGKRWRNVLIKERPGGEVYNLYSNTNNNRPAAYIVRNAPATPVDARGTSQLPLNTWTHLAATYDGAVLRLFVNGVQAGSRSAPGSLVASSGPVRIGGNSLWGEFFQGRIDEVRIYRRALSPAEISDVMSTPLP
jgi:hypothetical protein